MNADEKKKKIIMLFIALGLILSVIFGVTFSYLAPSINNVESNSTVVFNAGTIAINYENGQNQINASEVLPGWTSIKEFSLTAINNTTISTSGAMNYAIKLIVEKNTFNDGTITYSIEGENLDNNGTIAYVLPNSLKKGASEVILGYGLFDTSSDISKGVTHRYTLTMAFPNKTYESQNEDLGKTLSAHIIIANEGESTFSNLTIIDDNNNLNKTMILKNNTAYELPNIASKTGAYFLGWNVESGNATINGNKITINGNASIKANYSSTNKIEFAYTGEEQIFTVPINGTYKIETWGAQGGDSTYRSVKYEGGYGAYSAGNIYLNKNKKMYINVGGKGGGGIESSGTGVSDSNTGYNGGGYGCVTINNSAHGGGGGATHIAFASGILSTFVNDINSILIVSGGGGGSSSHASQPSYSGNGGHAGGINGNDGKSANGTCYSYGQGGTQLLAGEHTTCSNDGHAYGSSANSVYTSNASFGLGGNYTTFNVGSGSTFYADAGGGGGYYGGGSAWHAAGGGGSGYIGNSLLTDKYMYCYNCTTSDVESTKTYTTKCAEETPTENCAKKGNGYARITMPEIKEGIDLSTITVVSEELKKVITIEAEKGEETEISVEGLTNSSLGFKSFEIEKGEATINKTKITPLSNTIVVRIIYKQIFNWEFAYTGGEQTFTAPKTGYYKIEAWGASGGALSNRCHGAYTSGIVALSKNEKLFIQVGGSGVDIDSTGIGGYNGGGATLASNGKRGATGGGATDVRYSNNTLYNRIMVAGGGSGYGLSNYGHAGGLTGYDGSATNYTYYSSVGKGATQIAGGNAPTKDSGATSNGTAGSFGQGGTGGASGSGVSYGGGASGGGGYYGGSGASGLSNGSFGGGGGSSYISGHTGCVAIASSTSTTARTGASNASCTTGTTDNLCSIHYSGKVFTDTVMIDGEGYSWTNVKGALTQMPNPSGGYYDSGVGHSGNGYARITLIS